MEFQFETLYDQEALTAMAKGLRKILRKRNSLIMRVFTLSVFVIGLCLSTPLFGGPAFEFTVRSVLTYLALLLMLITTIWEDALNGFMAKKRVNPDAAEVTAIFTEENYTIRTALETHYWQYPRINYLAETKHYFVLIFDKNHAQVFDKDELNGGTEEEFRQFITNKTNKEFKRV